MGTKLATSWDQPALGGVYKLSAIRPPGGEWTPRVKVSEATTKVTTPGVLAVRRYLREDGTLSGDMVYDLDHAPVGEALMVDPARSTRRKSFAPDADFEELLVPVFRRGERVYDCPPLAEVRKYAAASLATLDPSILRFLNPHSYPVGLERWVNDCRTTLVLKVRALPDDERP